MHNTVLCFFSSLTWFRMKISKISHIVGIFCHCNFKTFDKSEMIEHVRNEKELFIEHVSGFQFHPLINQKKKEKKMSIYVGNLPYHLTTEELEQEFSRFGPCKATIAKDKSHDYRSLGYGFIDFENEEDKAKCLATNPPQLEIKGRTVDFREARERRTCNDTAFITELGPNHNQEFLEELFHDFHPLEVKLIKGYISDERPGFGFAKFSTQQERDAAIAALNGTQDDGRTFLVRIADRPFSDEAPRRFRRRRHY